MWKILLLVSWWAVATAADFEHMDVQAVDTAFKQGWAPFVLDVRTENEAKIARLKKTDALIPHIELAARLSEVPKDRDILVFCHSGYRSARAAEILKANGYGRVVNMTGGINAWAKTIDSTMKTY